MKSWTIIAAIMAILLTAGSAYAELPKTPQRVESSRVTMEQLVMTDTKLNALKQRLEKAVFLFYCHQDKAHQYARNGVSFDGAVVAVTPEAVREIIPKDAILELPPEAPTSVKSRSFFNRGLDNKSSPFHKKEKAKPKYVSERQYYLTTADWLTNSITFEIDISGKRHPAVLEYRDDAQNVAIISTQGFSEIEPVEIFDADVPMPGIIYILLNPNTMYESLTQHVISIEQSHLYGTTNLTARNGYPLFTADGQLAGLTVGPDPANVKAFVVHPGIIDRALHPAKYDRTIIEKVEIKEY